MPLSEISEPESSASPSPHRRIYNLRLFSNDDPAIPRPLFPEHSFEPRPISRAAAHRHDLFIQYSTFLETLMYDHAAMRRRLIQLGVSPAEFPHDLETADFCTSQAKTGFGLDEGWHQHQTFHLSPGAPPPLEFRASTLSPSGAAALRSWFNDLFPPPTPMSTPSPPLQDHDHDPDPDPDLDPDLDPDQTPPSPSASSSPSDPRSSASIGGSDSPSESSPSSSSMLNCPASGWSSASPSDPRSSASIGGSDSSRSFSDLLRAWHSSHRSTLSRPNRPVLILPPEPNPDPFPGQPGHRHLPCAPYSAPARAGPRAW